MPANESSPFEFDDAKPAQRGLNRSPITMAFMFYLVTLGAIVSACLRTLVGSDTVTDESLFRLLLVGIAIGFFSGGAFGLFYLRTRSSLVICSGVGILVGALAGGLSLVKADYFLEIVLIAFLGCWLLVLVMVFFARQQSARS